MRKQVDEFLDVLKEEVENFFKKHEPQNIQSHSK
jgi:cell division septum initiation protein DivIVA